MRANFYKLLGIVILLTMVLSAALQHPRRRLRQRHKQSAAKKP